MPPMLTPQGWKRWTKATADECRQVIYPAALTASTAHAEEAQAFLDYLSTDDAAAIFESVGFAMVK